MQLDPNKAVATQNMRLTHLIKSLNTVSYVTFVLGPPFTIIGTCTIFKNYTDQIRLTIYILAGIEILPNIL